MGSPNTHKRMGKPQAKKRQHKNIKDFKKKHRLRKKTKDLDEIHEDMKDEKADAVLHQKVDPDLPGGGQFYCIFCTRYFMSEKILKDHERTKNHKKRVKLLKETPYTQAEADMAAGMGSYRVQKKIDEDKLPFVLRPSKLDSVMDTAATTQNKQE